MRAVTGRRKRKEDKELTSKSSLLVMYSLMDFFGDVIPPFFIS